VKEGEVRQKERGTKTGTRHPADSVRQLTVSEVNEGPGQNLESGSNALPLTRGCNASAPWTNASTCQIASKFDN